VILGISVEVSPGAIDADAICRDADDQEVDSSEPFELESEASIECSYDADVPDGEEREHTAIATEHL
jgi:hypothetical protein